jgi:imidazoleglycerol-phosphate dehydratase
MKNNKDLPSRVSRINRTTSETAVDLYLSVDGSPEQSPEIDTGLPFLDHMLQQIAVHGLFDLKISAKGDLEIDPHHTTEDVALTLGQGFREALGDRAGIVRMASAYCPMDESLAWVAVDLSGRPYTVFDVEWQAPAIGGIPSTLFKHFFESFSLEARCNLHLRALYGDDDHHKAEALFKAFGRALDASSIIDPRRLGVIPSSKGILY